VEKSGALASLISGIPLFHGLPRQQQEDLAKIVLEQAFKRGQAIFSEGDEGAGFYVLISGRAKVFKLSPEGKEQILHILGPGEPFGEVPVFAGEHFPASAEALADCRSLFFPRSAFIDLVRKNPSLAMNMLAVLSRRLRRFASLVEDLSLKEVPGRLAAYLLYLKGRQKQAKELTLDISKTQLSALLGTIPETLSRILTRMTREKLIKLSGRRIQVLNPAVLEELASGERRLS